MVVSKVLPVERKDLRGDVSESFEFASLFPELLGK